MIGQTLSHYRITAAIGAGGMGEVYRATDTNLNREVAIKVLPAEVAQDPERLARFRREAHLLAALNHPNIAAIYGLEESGGAPFLALELVEGEDLSERLARGAIPLDEALAIAVQVAEALEEAHNKGIVHRDLKPANVKLTPDGKVKVLDFGLAKAWAGDAAGGSSGSARIAESPTIAYTGTVVGVILGTAAYMSPEQARGRPVDRRADVWAFGVLLWEMLTGRRLFTGETVTDVIAAVVTREPELDALPKATPRAVRRLLARCLRKDPRMRLPDMGTARLELLDVLSGAAEHGDSQTSAEIEQSTRRERARRIRERWGWAVATTALAAVAIALAAWPRASARVPAAAAHFVVETPDTLIFQNFDDPALSPDGRYVAFAGLTRGGTTQLWLRPLAAQDARPLPATDGAGGTFWSADSAAIFFEASGELRKFSLESGTIQKVCVLQGLLTGGSSSEAGTIVFSAGGEHGTLYQVPAVGGDVKPLTTLDTTRGETGQWWPQFLPGGRDLLVSIGSSQAANAGLSVISLDAPAGRRRILPDLARFVYADGYLLAAHDGVLAARPFDRKQLEATGPAVPVASPVATWNINHGWAWFSASSTGRLAWVSGRENNQTRLRWIGRDGRALGVVGDPANYGQLSLSPDGSRAVAEIVDKDGQFDLWLIDVARGVASRLTSDPANERDAVWSPDGQEIVFSSDASGIQHLLRKRLNDSGSPAPLPGGIGQVAGVRSVAESWSRAKNTLLFMTINGPDRALWAAVPDGGQQPELLAKDHFAFDEHHVSPDGRWLAYVSTESGRFEVYVQPFRRPGEVVRVSTAGGGQPRWRGDSRELFYVALDGALVAVSIGDGLNGAVARAPTTLLAPDQSRAVIEGPDYDDYDVTADGQRFLVKTPGVNAEQQRIHVLLDWPSMLK